jgi:hypothetical protein
MEPINELAAALAKAQGEIEPAPKDADNPFFKSKYASLPAVREAMRHAFAAHGLSVVQIPEVASGPDSVGQLRLRTLLLHSSGQSLDCGVLSADVDITNPQKMGALVTYFRRYSLAAISQTVADEDDDGNAASQPKKKGPPLSVEHIAELTLAVQEATSVDALTAILKTKGYQTLKANGPEDEYAKLAKLAKARHSLLSTEGT